MEPAVNTAQAAAWNGPEGEHWAGHHTPDGAANTELTTALLAAATITDASRILDIGCGTGETTRLAAGRAPHGHALGVDLSAVMLARARTETTAPNVTFEQGDTQVHPFPTHAFDVAISRFGIMFFTDPVAAFANIRRALRPGGTLAFVTPRAATANTWWVAPMAALRDASAAAELPDSEMFSLADPQRTTAILTAARLTNIHLQPLDVPMDFGADAHEAADFYLGSGPVRALLERHPTLTPAAAHDIVVDAVRPFQSPSGVRIPGAHWLVTARS
jgi:SAM-dependent methyltransferase